MTEQNEQTQEQTPVNPAILNGAAPNDSTNQDQGQAKTPETEQQNADSTQQGVPAGKSGDDVDGDAKATRPEGLPDQYWNDEKGVDFENLLKDHNELNTLKAELDIRNQGVPAKAEDYTLNKPAEIEGIDAETLSNIDMNEDDPLVQGFREYAHEHKLTQEQFDSAVKLHVRTELARAAELESHIAAERKQLGTDAEVSNRVNALTTALKARGGTDEEIQSLMGGMVKADQIRLLEKVIRTGPQTNIMTSQGDNQGSLNGKSFDDMDYAERRKALMADADAKAGRGR